MKTNTKFVLFAATMAAQAAQAAQAAHAQQTPTTFTDQNKLIRAPQAVTRLGADLFGDKVNLYTGSLEFVQADISLPGNSALPVAVGRHIRIGEDWLNQTLFGRWDLEIHHLHGVFSQQKGWMTVSGTTARCSQFSDPPRYQPDRDVERHRILARQLPVRSRRRRPGDAVAKHRLPDSTHW